MGRVLNTALLAILPPIHKTTECALNVNRKNPKQPAPQAATRIGRDALQPQDGSQRQQRQSASVPGRAGTCHLITDAELESKVAAGHLRGKPDGSRDLLSMGLL